jgi:hypothetical protein
MAHPKNPHVQTKRSAMRSFVQSNGCTPLAGIKACFEHATRLVVRGAASETPAGSSMANPTGASRFDGSSSWTPDLISSEGARRRKCAVVTRSLSCPARISMIPCDPR